MVNLKDSCACVSSSHERQNHEITIQNICLTDGYPAKGGKPLYIYIKKRRKKNRINRNA